MNPYRLPLKFILLWIVNIVLLLVLTYAAGLHRILPNLQIKTLAYIYLAAGAILAVLEQELWDKLSGNE